MPPIHQARELRPPVTPSAQPHTTSYMRDRLPREFALGMMEGFYEVMQRLGWATGRRPTLSAHGSILIRCQPKSSTAMSPRYPEVCRDSLFDEELVWWALVPTPLAYGSCYVELFCCGMRRDMFGRNLGLGRWILRIPTGTYAYL